MTTPMRSLAVALAVLVSACASVPMATPEQDAEAKQFKAPADKASVYVYRNETYGAAATLELLLDGKLVGETAARTYFVLPLRPGSHTLTSKSENVVNLPIQVEAGRTYFFWQEVKMGIIAARSALNPVDEGRGRAGVLECRLARPDAAAFEAGCTQATDCKGGRTCVNGTCVEPRPEGAPST